MSSYPPNLLRPYIGDREEAPGYHLYNPFIHKGYRINYRSWSWTLWSLFQFHNETINVWTHFIGFWGCFFALLVVFFNYKTVVVEDGPQTLNLSQVDVDGYDFGYVHSQTYEFKVFLMTLKQYLKTTPPDESTDINDIDTKQWHFDILKAEIVTKWPLLAYLMTALFCMGCSSACHLCYVRNERVSNVVRYLDYWGISILFLGSCYPYISFKYACGPFIVWRYIFITVITVLTVVCMWATV